MVKFVPTPEKTSSALVCGERNMPATKQRGVRNKVMENVAGLHLQLSAIVYPRQRQNNKKNEARERHAPRFSHSLKIQLSSLSPAASQAE